LLDNGKALVTGQVLLALIGYEQFRPAPEPPVERTLVGYIHGGPTALR